MIFLENPIEKIISCIRHYAIYREVGGGRRYIILNVA
jgi:hypothetical protein